MRGTWFKGSSIHDNWEPIDESDAEKIELGHQGVVRSLVRQARRYCLLPQFHISTLKVSLCVIIWFGEYAAKAVTEI